MNEVSKKETEAALDLLPVWAKNEREEREREREEREKVVLWFLSRKRDTRLARERGRKGAGFLSLQRETGG